MGISNTHISIKISTTFIFFIAHSFFYWPIFLLMWKRTGTYLTYIETDACDSRRNLKVKLYECSYIIRMLDPRKTFRWSLHWKMELIIYQLPVLHFWVTRTLKYKVRYKPWNNVQEIGLWQRVLSTWPRFMVWC